MLKHGLIYGLLSGGTMVALFLIFDQIFGYETAEDMAKAEIAGYIGMLLSLLVMVLGIHRYRVKGRGNKGFLPYFGLGSFITFIAAVMFGIYSYTWVLANPQFTDMYYDASVEQIEQDPNLSEEDKAVKLDKMEQQREMFSTPVVQGLIMMMTVLPIGIIISLLTGAGFWWLDKRQQQMHGG